MKANTKTVTALLHTTGSQDRGQTQEFNTLFLTTYLNDNKITELNLYNQNLTRFKTKISLKSIQPVYHSAIDHAEDRPVPYSTFRSSGQK